MSNSIGLQNEDCLLLHEGRFSEYGYCLREPSENGIPGVVIDNHQGKHSSWPVTYKGDRGERFTNLGQEEVITLAKVIVDNNGELFNSESQGVPPTKKWEFDKRDFSSRKGLFKKLKNDKVQSIGISAGFAQNRKTWDMHFYPNKKR